MKEFISWELIDECITDIAFYLKDEDRGKVFEGVYGIPRGGALLAILLSHKMDIPYIDRFDDVNENVVIIDDIADTGNTLKKYKNHEYLIKSLPYILEANPDTEAYWVPRVNTVAGITEEHIAKWGWRLDEKNRVNWPDWQMRLYRNSDNIYWIKPVHEQLKGYTKFANLPPEEKYALYHPKNIGRQERQNKFYETI